MRVLIISNMYPRPKSTINGIFVHEKVRALQRLGVDVQVLSGEPAIIRLRRPLPAFLNLLLFLKHTILREEWAKWCRHDDIVVGYCWYPVAPSFMKLRHTWRLYRDSLVRAATCLHKTFPFDVVHAHTAYLDGTAALAIGKRFNVPVVLTEHTGPFSTLTEDPAVRAVTERSLNAADEVMAVSEFLKNQVLDQIRFDDPDRIRVIGNSVDPDVFQCEPLKTISREHIYAVWIGHHQPIKQVPMLVDALGIALREEPRLRLRLIGPIATKEVAFQRIIESELVPYVNIHLSASRSEIARIIGDSHFLVISSKAETFSVVAIEALSCGRPVLTTRCGGPEEIVSDDSFGMVVDNDVESLARGLVDMARRIDGFDSDAIRGHAIENHSSERLARELMSIYRARIDRLVPPADNPTP